MVMHKQRHTCIFSHFSTQMYRRLLTHWGRVTHIYVGILTNIGSDNYYYNNYYLNQCWNIVNWTLRNKLQWNFHSRKCTKNVVCKMASILSRPQWVKQNRTPGRQGPTFPTNSIPACKRGVGDIYISHKLQNMVNTTLAWPWIQCHFAHTPLLHAGTPVWSGMQ